MRVVRLCAGAATILAPRLPVAAHRVLRPANAGYGLVRLHHCAGVTDTAFQKVSGVFTRKTGIEVQVTGGTKCAESRQAQCDADILWDIAEESIAALFENYGALSWSDVTPIFVDEDADIWTTQAGRSITYSGLADPIKPAKNRTIWRDVNVVLTSDANPLAKRFLDFLTSGRGLAIMRTEGWIR